MAQWEAHSGWRLFTSLTGCLTLFIVPKDSGKSIKRREWCYFFLLTDWITEAQRDQGRSLGLTSSIRRQEWQRCDPCSCSRETQVAQIMWVLKVEGMGSERAERWCFWYQTAFSITGREGRQELRSVHPVVRKKAHWYPPWHLLICCSRDVWANPGQAEVFRSSESNQAVLLGPLHGSTLWYGSLPVTVNPQNTGTHAELTIRNLVAQKGSKRAPSERLGSMGKKSPRFRFKSHWWFNLWHFTGKKRWAS